jgi:hypothetical protein
MSEIVESLECSICFYPITSDKYVTECEHTFHNNCLNEWTVQKPSCPLCNASIHIPEFNYDIEIQYAELTEESHDISANVITSSNLDYKRYIETIWRQRLNEESNNERANVTPFNGDSTVILINDYTEFNVTNGSDINNQDVFDVKSKRNRTLIALEVITTCSAMSYSVNVLHTSIALVAGATTISWRTRSMPNKLPALLFKIIYLIYYIYKQNDLQIVYAFAPWFAILIFN